MSPDFLLLFFRTIGRFVVNANLEKTFDGGDKEFTVSYCFE